MTSIEVSDEEYLDDPIQLIDFRQKASKNVYNYNKHNNQPIFELTDPEGDLYIEKNNNVLQKTCIPYKKVSITLPVSFFEIPRNVQLLNSCKQLSIKLVNCEKYPWFVKNSNDTDREVNFYIKRDSKEIINIDSKNEKMTGEIKIRPVSSPYEKLKVDNPKNKPRRKEGQLRQSNIDKQNLDTTTVSNSSNLQIDFKKNQGLIGMKIIQTPEISLQSVQKIKIGNKNITSFDKTVDELSKIEKIKRNKLKAEKKKKKLCENNKTVQEKQTGPSITTNVNKFTNDTDKAIKKNTKDIGKVMEMTIKKVYLSDKTIQNDTEVDIIQKSTNIQKCMSKDRAVEPEVKKNNVEISEQNEEITKVQDINKNLIQSNTDQKNLALTKDLEINDKIIQNKTKAHSSEKLNSIQEVKEKEYQSKFCTANKPKVPEVRDKMNQNNDKVVGNHALGILNVYEINSKTDSNNTSVAAKCNMVINEQMIDDITMVKSNNYSNSASVQTVLLSGRQTEEQLGLTTSKEKLSPETSYSVKLQGLKLTVTKNECASNVNKNTKTSLNEQKHKKAANQVQSSDKKKVVPKKKDSDSDSDPVKTAIGNDISNLTSVQNHSMLNIKIFKPEKKKCKKNNLDTKAVKEKPEKKTISNDSKIKNGNNITLLTKKIMNNADSDIVNNKSNKFSCYQNSSGVDKSSHLNEGTSAVVSDDDQSCSFNINKPEKNMQSSSQQSLNYSNDSQILNRQDNSTNFNKPLKVPCIDSTVKTESQVVNHNAPNKNMLTSQNKVLSNNLATKNNNNVSVTQKLPKNMQPSAPVTSNLSVPICIEQSTNQNRDCFATCQSNLLSGNYMSKYTHVVKKQPYQIPLNIPPGTRCPKILKISKHNPAIAYVNTNNYSNPEAGNTTSYTINPKTQNNNNSNQSGNNNYRIQERPIQNLVTIRDNMTKQKPIDLQATPNSQMLSHFYSAAQQISRKPLIPNQNVQQLPIAHQTKQPIASSNIQIGSHLQAANLHEILPPTCDIAMAKVTPGYDIQNLYCQNMPNTTAQPRQQKNVPNHMFLRNEPHLGKDRLQIQPNMKTASCNNMQNLNFLLQEKTPLHRNIDTVTPRQGTFQNGYAHPENVSPYGQGFQQAFSEFNGTLKQNYLHCAPIYDGIPNNMNPPNKVHEMQNYWGNLYNPLIPPPPPPPQPPPVQVLGQSDKQKPGLYQQYNNPLTTKSVAGTTIIGQDDAGPVRKININVEPLGKKLNDTTPPEQANRDRDTSKSLISHKFDTKITQSTDSKKEILGHSQVANSKKEMLEELTKITTVENSNLSPVKDLKRSIPNTDTVKEIPKIPNIKRSKPGPLSKKLKLDSITSSQAGMHIAPVTHKGYSPPILPIPTYQKTLEILARSNIADPRLSHSISYDNRETETANAVGPTKKLNHQMQMIQKITKRKCPFDENQEKSAKKITLDEYKKRTSKIEDIKDLESNRRDLHIDNIRMEIKIENPEQDLGYDSDFTTKI